jgi:hypothetical protein
MYAQVPFNERRIAWSMLGCTILAAGLWGLGPASMEDIACGVTITLLVGILIWGVLSEDDQSLWRCDLALALFQLPIYISWGVLLLLAKPYLSESNAKDFVTIVSILLITSKILIYLSFVPLIHLTIHGWLRLLFRPQRA